MSFHSFVDLIQSKCLNFVRPKVWEDPYEGFIFQKLKTENGKNEIRELIKPFPENIAKKVFLDLALKFEKTFYAQSWSLCPESDAMWRIYNFERKTIRIEVLETQVRRIDDIMIIDVDYHDEIDLKKEIEKIGLSNDQTKFSEVFRLKRKAFEHEEEVRLIYQYKDAINEKTDAEKKLFENALAGTELEGILSGLNKTYSDFYKLDISNIPNFIDSVCIHPQAPDWFNLTMKTFCKLNGQKYLGKSSLYGTV